MQYNYSHITGWDVFQLGFEMAVDSKHSTAATVKSYAQAFYVFSSVKLDMTIIYEHESASVQPYDVEVSCESYYGKDQRGSSK